MQRIAAWFPAALLAVFAALTFWLDQQVQEPERGRDGKTRHDPDYMVQNFSATKVGPDGKPRYTLSAHRMVHYPDDDTTLLETPKLVKYGNPLPTVTAVSKTALLSSNGEEARLMDDVRLVRSAYDGKSAMTMETSYLRVIPDANTADTDRPVKIYDANSLTTSNGLKFNSETSVLNLLSNVRIYYEKAKPAH